MSNLITGASGFVGQNLIPYLKEEKLLNRLLSRTELINANVKSLAGASTIVHLAGKAHDLKNVASPDEYYYTNYELTKQLYDAFLASDAKKFIFVSSVKAAADEVKGILTESHTSDPKTIYGKSKLMAEQYIKNKPLPKDKSYYILRPCMIHGPGNKGNLNLLYKLVEKGIPYPLAEFDNKRSFLSIQNFCFVVSALILRDDIDSGVYNISDDEPLSTNEVVEILSSSLNKKAKLWHIPSRLIKILSLIGDKLHLPLTTERLQKLTESYVVSNQKITAALNKPMPVSAKEGLRLTATSFQNSDK